MFSCLILFGPGDLLGQSIYQFSIFLTVTSRTKNVEMKSLWKLPALSFQTVESFKLLPLESRSSAEVTLMMSRDSPAIYLVFFPDKAEGYEWIRGRLCISCVQIPLPAPVVPAYPFRLPWSLQCLTPEIHFIISNFLTSSFGTQLSIYNVTFFENLPLFTFVSTKL